MVSRHRLSGSKAGASAARVDIIVLGTGDSVRSLLAVEIPAAEGYSALYNPGGPGPNPVPDTRYTAAGPPDVELIIDAIDDPMRVTRQEIALR